MGGKSGTSLWSFFSIKGFGKSIHGTAITDKSNNTTCISWTVTQNDVKQEKEQLLSNKEAKKWIILEVVFGPRTIDSHQDCRKGLKTCKSLHDKDLPESQCTTSQWWEGKDTQINN